ncbi:MAG: type II secretion system F family protein [Rickettsiales bacterium]|nr:type II secretion system F family protein [Rickettsiales bacterium]
MPSYDYTALNAQGRSVRGNMTAANVSDLEDRLKQIGLDLTFYKQKKERSFFNKKRLTPKDLITLCIHLEQLERAGVPLLESIADLRDSADNASMKNMMSDVYESIKGGKLLSAALEEHSSTFDTVFTGLVAAGEKTGNLADVFHHLSNHLRWVSDTKRKLRKAVTYPIFLLLVSFAVITVMMVWVIPQLSSFLTQQNFELPVYTKALIVSSEAFQQYWQFILVSPVGIFIFIKVFAYLSDEFAYQIDNIKLNMPIMGNTVRKIETARFCHFFAITFKSGIDILECLDVGRRVVKNKVIRESIKGVRVKVSEGSLLTDALRQSNHFPSLVIRMFKVGEETGNFDKSLENVNFFYDREVDDSVSAMIAMLQPALTIILGGIMFWVTLAVFGPLYSSFSEMNF